MLVFLILLAAVALGLFLAYQAKVRPPALHELIKLPLPRAITRRGLMAAVKGKGAKLWVWDSELGTPALVQVGELVAVTPPSATRDTVDTTHHGSVGDYREFVSNLIDAGEVSATINWLPGGATDTLLQRVFEDGEVTAFAIDVNTSTPGTQRRISGNMLLTEFAPDEIGIEDKMAAGISMKVSGPLTFGATP